VCGERAEPKASARYADTVGFSRTRELPALITSCPSSIAILVREAVNARLLNTRNGFAV
jgi:hypothetical protein